MTEDERARLAKYRETLEYAYSDLAFKDYLYLVIEEEKEKNVQ